MDQTDPPADWEERADCALRPARPMIRYLSAKHGKVEAARIAAELGLTTEDFDDKARWVSLEQLEAFFQLVRERVGSDKAFMEAASYRLAEDGFGPMRYLLWATTPGALYRASARHAPAVLAHGSYEVVRSTPTSIRMRYRSAKPESRLFCLLRHSQGAALPTVWGLPPAHLEESSCLAHGDDYCEYHIRWFVRPRWSSDVAGALLGGAGSIAAFYLGADALSVWIVLPLLGALLGRLFETRRVSVLNTGIAGEIQETLRETIREEAETRRELLALEARRREWSQLMEQAVAERTQAVREIAERLDSDLRHGTQRMRGFTHDMRGPVSVFRANTHLLRRYVPHPEGAELLDEQVEAVEWIERMLHEMVTNLPDERRLVHIRPTTIRIADLAESVRRRLRALCYGKPIRSTVFTTREAPDQILQDTVVLNRVIDNLLTNAAKYTESGSILIEVSGTPGMLTLKISDTGRGIEPEDTERVFQPGGSTAALRAEHSYGIGLSVVVQLLDQIGGRLELMSRPSQGTTFWVHVPVRAESTVEPDRSSVPEAAFSRVVRIRKAASS